MTASIKADPLFERYQELQAYVGWNDEHAACIRPLANLVEPRLPELVDDFYDEIQRHPQAMRVFTGGQPQIERLKGSLAQWLRELLAGPYDANYVARRWRVGYRHVEIGLDQVYTNVALSRLRRGLHRLIEEQWTGMPRELLKTRNALNMLLDLDLAIIEDAYQAEHLNRQQQVERLAAIGQVAGGIAHELRNPMNVIKSSAYFLLNARHPTPEKTSEHLTRIELQVERADGVITALSNFARLPIPNLRPFEVEPFVREALADADLPPEVAVHVESPTLLAQPLGDVDQLLIVIRNLIRNAHDAMPDGGTLTIRAAEEGDHITIAVTDTGPGIAAENVHRIMQPLFTTKARGIGLGLAMARAIVEKCDGTLTVASVPGEGATFTIRLPAEVGTAGGND
ncbi:MAG: sensor histidine kinase [Planctomycetaceae bacterium]